MSKVGLAITKARTRLASKADKFLPDLCDIEEIGLVSDGFSGHKPGENVIASNIPCRFDEVPQGAASTSGGGVSYQATHKIRFPATATTMAIKPSQILRIQANGNHEELRFEQPVRAQGSMLVFVTASAKLTTGHREPANV